MKRKVLAKLPSGDDCVVCGVCNDHGLKARFYALEGDEVLGVYHPTEAQQSYPGRVHGGISAALLDETMGRAVQLKEPDTFGVTMTMQVTYRKPLPTGKEAHVVGRITRDRGRVFEATGEILLSDGSVAVEGWGRYLRLPIEKITDASAEELNYIPREGDDLTEIDL